MMKQLFIAGVLALVTTTAAAQHNATIPNVTDSSDITVWFNLMQDDDANFYEVKAAYDQYFATHPKGKGTGWKVFERWASRMERKIGPDGTIPPLGPARLAWEQYKSQKGIPANPGDWTEIGPTQVPVNATGQPTGLGRINGIGFHPSNANTAWACAPAGGLWKTTDAGTTWTQQNTDFLTTIGISSVVVDYSNANIIYMGTGDRDGGGSPGMGVWKSTDGGSTWTQSATGMGNERVGHMLMHPTNNAMLLAATSDGIYKSTDSGANWTRKSASTSHFRDIRFKPGDPSIVYATEGGRFYRSTDTGETWTQVTSGVPSNSRLVIGVSPAAPDTVYILCSGSAPFVGLYISTDSGQNFSQQSNSPNILGYSNTGSDGSSQAGYDLCIAVDRSDADIIYAGGINIWKSTDAGQNWTISAHWVGGGGIESTHADQHCLEINPLDDKVWNGNDGGVYTTSDGGTNWVDVSDDLAVGMIYRIGMAFAEREFIVAGFQDNGVGLWDNGAWTTIAGGDGMSCAIDYDDPKYVYSSYIDAVRRSSNYGIGSNSTIADQGVNGITESGAWVSPYLLHRTDPNTMFLGYKNVWRTNDVRNSPPTWTKISDNLGGSNSSNISAMANSSADPNILYVSRSDDKLFRTDDCMAGTPTWVDLTATLPYTNQPNDIEPHPTNPEVVYVVADNKVWKSSDRGQNWSDISGSIPTAYTVNCIAVDKLQDEALYVATDVSVFYRDTSMTDWIVYDGGLPVVEILDLQVFYGYTDSRLRAATFGRGLWETPLYHDPSELPVANFEAEQTTIAVSDTVYFTDISGYSPTSWSWTISPVTYTFVEGTSSSSQHPKIRFDAAGTYTITLQATNANGSDTKSVPAMIDVFSETASPCEGATTTLGGYGMGIHNVTFNTINHSSGQAHQDNPNAPAGYVSN